MLAAWDIAQAVRAAVCGCHFSTLPVLLQEVLFVMGARLVEIDEKWKHGGLQRAGLTSNDVVHLVSILPF